MSFLADVLSFLDSKMTTPTLYGPFHIVFLLLSVFAGFVISKHCLKKGEASIRRFLLIETVIVILLEIYKQINYTFEVENGQILADYQWYAFPFQFCCTPMYIGMLAVLTWKKPLHHHFCAYSATFSLFAGISVMLYPASVFVETIGVNIETMIAHGGMITVGMVLLRTGYVKISYKTVLKALPVFMVLVLIAMGMNEIAYRSGLLETETFNMFFISPYCSPELPVFSLVQPYVPFLCSVVIYIVGFTLASGIILALCKLLRLEPAKSKVTVE